MKRGLLATSIVGVVACIVGAVGLDCGGDKTQVPTGPSSGSSSGGNSGSSSGESGSSTSSSSGSSSSGGSTSSSGGSTSSSGASTSSSSGGGSSSTSSSSGSSSGSSSSSSSSGGAMDGGTTGFGAFSVLDNEQWLLPCGRNQSYSDLVCINQPGANCNGTMPYLTRGTINRDQTITLGGDPNTTYMVTARFRGVVEPKTYTGGVKANPTVKTDGWYVGGAPSQNGNYNVYMLGVSSPQQVYYLNSLGNQTPAIPEAHFSYMIDYQATFGVKGGAMIRFLADDSNCSAIKNCDSSSKEGSGGAGVCNPITVPGFTPVPNASVTTNPPAMLTSQPYNGQFIVLNLLSVTPTP